MSEFLQVLTIGSGVLLIIFVLIQTRGASLGSGFGGGSEVHTSRRGVDKTVHQITIVLAVTFALSIFLNLISN